MTHPIYPFIPEKNCRIGIFQTAKGSGLFPMRYQRGLNEIKRCFEDAVVTDYTEYSAKYNGYNPVDYAERFIKAVDENDILISLTGGYTTNCILPYLDYEFIKSKRPIICGYSDTTALLLSVFTKVGLITVYGPSLLGSFGEWKHMNDDTMSSLRRLVFPYGNSVEYHATETTSDSNYYWDKYDQKPIKYYKNTGWFSNCDAAISGISYGGNLNTLLAVLNTPYCKIPNDSILFIEDAFTQTDKFMRDLETLKQQTSFEGVKGVLIGKPFQSGTEQAVKQMNEYALEFFSGMQIPAMANVDFGHCAPMLSIPVGKQLHIDYGRRKIQMKGNIFSGIA